MAYEKEKAAYAELQAAAQAFYAACSKFNKDVPNMQTVGILELGDHVLEVMMDANDDWVPYDFD